MHAVALPFALALATLPLAAAAQQTPQKPASQKPARQQPSPAEARIQRLHKDLERTLAQLQRAHAFEGTVQFTSENELNQMVPLDKAFVGASDGKDHWFTLDEWRVVHRGDRTAVLRDKDGEWSEPLGDTPDVPLTPSLLLAHFKNAKLTPPKPTMHDHRPAMRVHATWSGKAAKDVMFTTTVPSSQHEQLLEALATAAKRGNKNVLVQATLLYDPATRRWIEATLRFAYLDGRPFPEGEQPPEAPHGLSPLPGRVALQSIWHLRACATKKAPKPALDAEAKRLLQPRKRR